MSAAVLRAARGTLPPSIRLAYVGSIVCERYPAGSSVLQALPARFLVRSHTGEGQTCFETNSKAIVRTMFVLYTLLIVGGIVVFVTVGLTQQ